MIINMTIEQAKELLRTINEIEKTINVVSDDLYFLNRMYVKKTDNREVNVTQKILELASMRDFINEQRINKVIPYLIEAIESNTTEEVEGLDLHMWKTMILKDLHDFLDIDENKRKDYILDKCSIFSF